MKFKLTWEIEHEGLSYANSVVSSDFGDVDLDVAKKMLKEGVTIFGQNAEMSMANIVYGINESKELEKMANRRFRESMAKT